jgi:hypothetical protein
MGNCIVLRLKHAVSLRYYFCLKKKLIKFKHPSLFCTTLMHKTEAYPGAPLNGKAPNFVCNKMVRFFLTPTRQPIMAKLTLYRKKMFYNILALFVKKSSISKTLNALAQPS